MTNLVNRSFSYFVHLFELKYKKYCEKMNKVRE